MKECKHCKQTKALWRFPHLKGKIQNICKTCEVKIKREKKENEKLTPDERVELFIQIY